MAFQNRTKNECNCCSILHHNVVRSSHNIIVSLSIAFESIYIFSWKLSELGSRLGFGVQGLGAPLTAAVHPAELKKSMFNCKIEKRLGGPGPISELRRHGLSQGPNGVSRSTLDGLWGWFLTLLVWNLYFCEFVSPISVIIVHSHWIWCHFFRFDFVRIHVMWFAAISFDSIQCDSIRFDSGLTPCWFGPIWFGLSRLGVMRFDSVWFVLIQASSMLFDLLHIGYRVGLNQFLFGPVRFKFVTADPFRRDSICFALIWFY